jgi:16S rRNA (cytosine1402-N4)-methyltransferase
MNDPVAEHAISSHIPVLLDAVVEHLRPGPNMRMLDCTLGMGGHSAALLSAGAHVVGIERDPRARELASARLAAFSSWELRAGTFADVVEHALHNNEQFDGVLADLGVSSLQLDDVQRGFSLRAQEPLDMRMDTNTGLTALELIDSLSADELANIIYRYGEERLSRPIARAIKQARSEGKQTGEEIAAVIRQVVRGHQQRHPALRTFQALRIAVNDELGQLERLLAALPRLLKAGGRAVIISFHSLEDRLVKQSFRANKVQRIFSESASRVVIASDEEIEGNSRAASAKLRWAVAGAAVGGAR